MIKYTPQRSDIYRVTYELNECVLKITLNDIEEVFDFTDFPDGIAEEITPELLPINPIVSVARVNGKLNITVIQFYDEAEKSEYEVNHED